MLCPRCVALCEETHQYCPRCGTNLAQAREKHHTDPLIGAEIGGNYRVRELIAEGGMGRVYAAEHTTLGKTVAIKFIHQHLLSDESAMVRFYTEARATSRLNHPNSVGVLDFGKTPEGQLYLVMEFLRGRDLSMILSDTPSLPFPRIANILRQVLSALADAHDQGIIHRDLKPDNILVEELRTGGDFVKVLDFGLAKIRGVADKGATVPGLICGTPEYMSPEQGRGDPLDPRSDLYSLGVILYLCLTGRLPFEHESPTETVLMHLTAELIPPKVVAPLRQIPDALNAIAIKVLRKDANERYASSLDMAAALDAYLIQDRGFSARCATCGAPNPSTAKFCGDCGARLAAAEQPTLPAVASYRRRTLGYEQRPLGPSTPAREPLAGAETVADLGFCGRDSELEVLLSLREQAGTQGMMVRLVGDSGIGKTRLLEVLGHRALAAGDLVIPVGPEPSWSSSLYHTLRGVVRELLGVSASASNGEILATVEGAGLSKAVQAGVREICEPEGAPCLDSHARRRAAAVALRELVAYRCQNGRVLVLVDDLHRCDSLSRAAIAVLANSPLPLGLFFVVAHVPSFDHGLDSVRELALAGLDAGAIGPMLQGVPAGDRPDELPFPYDPAQGTSPLYVEQFLCFQAEGGVEPPPRIADLLAVRIERLPPDARLLVQAAAILGEEMDVATITGVARIERDTANAFALLATRRFLVGDEQRRRFTHPLIPEVVVALIPAAARREMHARAVGLLAGTAPAETTAFHSRRSGEGFGALLLLERAGDRATRRGDLEGALECYRRGLEIARRELSRGDMDEPEHALLLFALRLGESLFHAGEPRRAEAVLREALDLGVGEAADRARVFAGLGEALAAQGRSEPAMAQLRDAARLARQSGRPLLISDMQRRLGLRLRSDGRLKEAVAELAAAAEAAGDASLSRRPDAELRARILLDLSETLIAAGDAEGARFPLAEALELAEEIGSENLSGHALRVQARALEAKGDLGAAESRFSRALAIFESLGDLDAVETMMLAIDRVSQPLL